MFQFLGLILRPIAGFAGRSIGRSIGRHLDGSGNSSGDSGDSGSVEIGCYWDPDDLARVNAMFDQIMVNAVNLTPLMNEIGATLEHSNRERFEQGVSWDGVAWVDLKALTLARKTTDRKLYERGDLFDSIRFEAGHDFVQLVAGPTEYAAVHQFGSDNVPARPYLGMSTDDADDIMDAMSDYIARISTV